MCVDVDQAAVWVLTILGWMGGQRPWQQWCTSSSRVHVPLGWQRPGRQGGADGARSKASEGRTSVEVDNGASAIR